MRSRIQRRLGRHAADETGATMLEYIFIATGIAVVVGVAAATLGLRLVPLFDAVTF